MHIMAYRFSQLSSFPLREGVRGRGHLHTLSDVSASGRRYSTQEVGHPSLLPKWQKGMLSPPC